MQMQSIWSAAQSILRDSRALLAAQLKEVGLGPSEAFILLHLYEQGEAIMQDKIAEHLGVSKPAISKALDGLEHKGFIERKRNEADRRIKEAMLTEKAQDVISHIRDLYATLYLEAARGFSPEEVHTLERLVGRVADRVSRYRAEVVGDVEPQTATSS